MRAGVFPYILTLLFSFYCSYLSIDAYFGQLVLNCVLECRLHSGGCVRGIRRLFRGRGGTCSQHDMVRVHFRGAYLSALVLVHGEDLAFFSTLWPFFFFIGSSLFFLGTFFFLYFFRCSF